MSFILDALKKSESARQDTNSPGIADVPVMPRRAGTPRWVPIVGVLLGVNLLALIYLLLRPDATPPLQATEARADRSVAAPTAALVPSTSTVAARPEPSLLASQPAPQPTERPAANLDAGSNRVNESARTDSVETAVTTTAARSESTAPPPAPAPAPVQEETWLTFADVRASGNLGLPDMHIDLHVYSSNAAERFVFINMKEYRERDTTTEGPTLQSITPEGALLEYRGSTFLLPRD